MRIQQIIVGGAVAFTTWLLLGIAAALANIPNFDAKRVGQECDCAITPLLGDLDIHIEVAGLLLSVWILIPAAIFSALSVIIVFKTPSWIMDRRNYLKGLKRSAIFGEVIGLIAVGIILAEASLTNSIIIYPSSDQQTPTTAENFGLLLTNGTRVELYDFKGRPTLLEFMWTKCSHCQNQTKSLQQIQNEFGSQINMISVAVTWGQDNIQALQEFDDKYGVTWTSGLDAGLGTDRFGASSVPRLFILDKDFNIVHVHVGQVPATTLTAEIDSVLNAG
ncbi:MAG: TlpA family protein disulfide reductase [Nitrososphaerales archaeon]